LTSLSIWVIF